MSTHKLPIFAAILFAATTASADVTSLVAAIKTETAVEAKLVETKATAVQANASLEKEGKLYPDQIKRLEPIKVAIEADATKLGGDVATYNAGVTKHNENCSGDKLPNAAVERCNGEKRYWDGRKATLEGQRDQLFQRATAYDRQLAPYTKRLGEIAAQTQANAKTIADADKGIAAARVHIVQLLAQLDEECKKVDADPKAKPEEIKYCHDRTWANAKPSQPPGPVAP